MRKARATAFRGMGNHAKHERDEARVFRMATQSFIMNEYNFGFCKTKFFLVFHTSVDQVRLDLHWCPFSSSRLFGAQLIFDVEGMLC